MRCFRSLVEVSRMGRDKNEEVRRRPGIEMELASRADQRVLKWLGHEERMDEYRTPAYGQKGVDGGSKRRSGTR